MSFAWHNSAFIATPGNAPIIESSDSIDTIFIQVAWGTGPPGAPISDEQLDVLKRYFKIGAWAWCQGADIAQEAEWHAEKAHEISAECFIANMEEQYDAHGNSSDPKYSMPTEYLDVLLPDIGDMPLGVTTTAKFGSDMRKWIGSGAIYMPQAFPLENFCTVEDAVEHGMAWGWPIYQIRPLVQTFQTGGQWPDFERMNTDAARYEIGVIPYTFEQGYSVFPELSESIRRPNPEPPLPPPEEGDAMQLIGSQHGIVAAYNRMKDIDPAGCNPQFDPNNYNALPVEQLKAWDKVARSLMIMREDHDEVVSNQLK